MIEHIPDISALDNRILVLAPFGQDGQIAAEVLARANLATTACTDIGEVCSEFRNGAGALLIANEALAGDAIETLAGALDEQPPWSDIPVFVFMPSTASAMAGRANGTFEPLRNVTLVERPVRIAALVSSLRSGLRARRRQYQVRDLVEKLQESNQAKDAFVAAVSHELRTPLNAILGWTATLRRSSDPARNASAIDVIERNGHVLSQLVEDLLDVARIATGRFNLTHAEVDMRTVVHAATDAIRPTAEAKNVRVGVTLPDLRDANAFVTVRGDSVRLQQVLWNLLWNAVKFTADGGVVQVDMRLDERDASDDHAGQRTIEVSVVDTGSGISPDLLPHVFEPFRQGTVAQGNRNAGLGLGLAIVRHLVELHGGSVAAYSDGIGQGATFIVRLPALGDVTDVV